MKPILVLYGTVEGQTAKIANVISNVLLGDGFNVEVINADSTSNVDVSRYSGIVAGAPVHISRFPEGFTKLIGDSARDFSKLPTAFFSVCLGILQKDEPETEQAEKDIVMNFFTTTGWSPDTWSIFPGALAYSKYGFFRRHLLHLMLRMGGKNTDIHRDQEFTDWNQVRSFALDFGKIMRVNREA